MVVEYSKRTARTLARALLAASLLFGAGLFGPGLLGSDLAIAAPPNDVQIGTGFNQPGGVAVDSSGNVFVADTSNHAVKEILAPGYTTTQQIATLNGNFIFPTAIAIDAGGNLFVADGGDGTVKKILANDSNGSYVTVKTIAGGFAIPTGIAVDADDNVFLADLDADHLFELVVADGYATHITLNLSFAEISGVAVDARGNLFITDQVNGIQESPAAGGYATLINLASTSSDIIQPYGIGLDAAGNLYYTDITLGAVFEIPSASGYQTPVLRFSGLNEPQGVAIGGSGNIYLAERNSNTVDELVAATTTGVMTSLTPSTLGTSVTFTATLTVSPTLGIAPTGSVTFMDEAAPLGTVTLTGTTAALATTLLSVGTHSITAIYGGDDNYAPSTSSVVTQEVDAEATTTILASSANPSTPGQSVTFTASVSAVGGTVTFMDGSALLNTVNLASGIATYTSSALSTGNHSITASYSGTIDFAASLSATLVQSVGLTLSITSLFSSANPSAPGQAVTFTAAVSSAGGVPAGTVSFLDGANPLGTGTLSGGIASFSTASLGAGSHSITASYGGSGGIAASASSVLTQTVAATATTTTLTSSVNPSTPGQAVSFTAFVTSAGGVPAGSVSFLDGATPLGSLTLSGGIASFSTASLGAGSHSITASYGGNTSFAASTSTALTQSVTAATSTTTLTASVNPSAAGQSVTFTAFVTSAGGVPSGTVSFLDGATTLGTGTLSGGLASFATSGLSTGSHSITASYGGGGGFAASVSTALTQTVTAAASTTALSTSLNPSGVGQAVTFSALVSGASGTPSGTVTFKDGATTLGAGTLASGLSSVTTAVLTQGSHSITASYGGDGNFTASTSTALTEIVNAAASRAVLTAAPNPSIVGQSVSFTATVSGPGGTPSGMVTFKDGPTALGTATLAAGSASFSMASLTAGSHAITASYGGDNTFGASVSTALAEVVETSSVAGQVYGYQNTLGTTGVAGSDAAHFSQPVPGAVDPAESHLFVADAGNHRVQVLDTGSLAVVATIGVTGIPGADNAHLDRPQGVGFDPSTGRVFVADTANQRVQIFESKSFAYVATLGTTGATGSDAAHFDLPGSAAVNLATHQLYVADTGNHRVQIFDAGTLALIATLGTSGVPGSDAAHLDQPSDAELDPGTSQILVADTGNQRVQIFDAASFTYVTTLGVTGTAGSDNTHFAQPVTASFDPATDLVLVADAGGIDRVQVFDAMTYAYVRTLGTVGSGGPADSQFAAPQGIASDPAHNRIFIGDGANERVQVFAIAPVVTVASVLPGSRSVQLGHPATVFASVLNAGATALADCRIALPVTAPSGLTLSYQTTDPATNALTGTPNAPATIPGADGVQSFLITLQGTTAFSVAALPLDFDCLGAAPAAVIPGVDTIDLTLSSNPIADIIALAATPTHNGIVEVPAGGAAAFAVASTNVGAAAPITVTADTGTASLPLQLTLCQSSPATGQCLATPSASVSLNDAAGAALTFSVFLQASGAIALDPAAARIFVRFKDSSGGLHGSTSVAVETR